MQQQKLSNSKAGDFDSSTRCLFLIHFIIESIRMELQSRTRQHPTKKRHVDIVQEATAYDFLAASARMGTPSRSEDLQYGIDVDPNDVRDAR